METLGVFDAVTWALLVAGAGVLVAGGALLRGGPVRDEEALRAEEEAREAAAAEIADLGAAIDRATVAHRKEVEALEKQLEVLRASVAQKDADLAVEAKLAQDMEASLEDTRAALRTAEAARKDAEKARDEARNAPSTPPKATAPKAVAPTDAASKARSADLERALAQTSAERDAAKQKIEALERLVEGVRARSRELTKELEAQKSKA